MVSRELLAKRTSIIAVGLLALGVVASASAQSTLKGQVLGAGAPIANGTVPFGPRVLARRENWLTHKPAPTADLNCWPPLP